MTFSRFDRVVLLFLVCAGLLTGLVIWRGDQVGLKPETISPAPGAAQVSTRARIQLTFGTRLQTVPQTAVTLQPPVAGRLTSTDTGITFIPDEPLAPDTEYQVTLSGINGQARRLLEPLTWTFRTTHPRIVYLGWRDDTRNQIYTADIYDESGPRPLSDAPNDVLDFAVSPDGAQIIYAVFTEEGGADLWLMDATGDNQRRLLACEMAACTNAVWLPNGRRLIYERRNIPAPGAPPGAPRLWWLDVVTRETVPIFQDSQLLGMGAQVSQDGAWLSYVSPVDQGIQVYNLESGSGLLIPNQMGSPAVWHPDQPRLALTNIQLDGEQWAIHLLSVDVTTEAVTSLSGEDAEVDDSSPVYSPDGMWIAFGRKEPRTAMGRQIWLMRTDGSDAAALTDNPDVHHGPFVWSPDGRYLLYQRYNLTELYAQPGIWLLDVETGAQREIATVGSRPIAWLP